ncbi:hypothetical protein GLOIN_2v1785001 [Rhizophagus irregularis DAOM 181602=DAOM 197198]|nr:hypothetical protein GLOIN_2v1785001 [Rhizophagus irregularis DAOM 181602=DAOM 197198]
MNTNFIILYRKFIYSALAIDEFTLLNYKFLQHFIPSTNSFPNTTSPQQHNSSLASVSQDSWISWISSSIIRGGSWISHLDFLRRLTVQPLRISF